jgi:hypothetical protein
MKLEKEPFTMMVVLTGGRKSSHKFFTMKSARHYAKGLCGNQNVVRISVAGPQGTAVLYDQKDAL